MMDATALLAEMPPPGEPVTIEDLVGLLEWPNRDVVRCVDTLRRRGLAQRLRRGKYRLTKAGESARAAGQRITSGPAGPHTGRRAANTNTTFRDRLWTALRTEGRTTVPDLVALAADGTEQAPEDSAHKYLGYLVKAGYVTKLGQREPGTAPTSNGFAFYLLLPEKNTGPRAPRYSQARREMYDPNTEKVVWSEDSP